MPRGRKPPPIKKQTQSQRIAEFSGRVEQATTAWLSDYETRRVALMAAFDELTRRVNEMAETDELVKLTAQLSSVHAKLTASETDMMRLTAIREQIAVQKGVSHLVNRESGTTNVQLNFAPSMTPEQRLAAERMFLAMTSGKEIEALPPPKTIEAQAQVA